ncbi:MAG TPA: amino acid transporter [Planctomycetaceae bacterium]|nr:amino acid transporter [Planctomycetaceae bacterium]|tara:strand:+ start:1473 stop:3101 length:1629 start_codon:yes stop_codon:yes gene_type:complete
MLGSGVFVLPAFAANTMGDGIWVAYLFAATVVLPAALSKSELASAMPSSGGSYVYLERTFGPFFGTISGIWLWSSFLLKSAFALIGFQAYLYVVTQALNLEVEPTTLGLMFLIVIVVLNILGVAKIKVVQSIIVVIAITSMILLCIAALFTEGTDLSKPVASAAFDKGFWSIAETAALVFVAYAGVTKIAAIAGEVKSPAKTLPRGMILSLIIAAALYSLVGYSIMAVLPENWWLDSKGNIVENPIYHFANAVGGKGVALAIAILAIFTMASMALSGVLASSRFGFAMARDNLLPQALEDVNPQFETPHVAILITGALMAGAIVWLPVEEIAKLVSGVQIMVFTLICFALIVLRTTVYREEGENRWYRPKYETPLYPWMQIWGICGGAYLLYTMGSNAAIGASATAIVGILIYFSYGRYHVIDQRTPYQRFKSRLMMPNSEHHADTARSIEGFRVLMKHPSQDEHNRRAAAFHAADMGGKNHLTLLEFQRAMFALGYDYNEDDLREIFHAADENEDGVLDIDQFLDHFEEDFDIDSKAGTEK